MDAQIDHVTGLLMLRENGRPLPLHATAEVLAELASGFPIVPLLGHYCGVQPEPLPLECGALRWPFLPRAHIAPVALASKPPPYSPWREAPRPGDNIGVTLVNEDTGRRLFYAPGLAEISPAVWRAMQAADVVLVDGTFWRDDEMIRLGLSRKSALDMGHLPQSGPGGMLEHLARLPAGTRKVLIHINNTNPVLREDGPEHAQLAAAGVELAFDGMEIAF
jgi:pyrroloquinoline quinone biosynthesis protein B